MTIPFPPSLSNTTSSNTSDIPLPSSLRSGEDIPLPSSFSTSSNVQAQQEEPGLLTKISHVPIGIAASLNAFAQDQSYSDPLARGAALVTGKILSSINTAFGLSDAAVKAQEEANQAAIASRTLNTDSAAIKQAFAKFLPQKIQEAKTFTSEVSKGNISFSDIALGLVKGVVDVPFQTFTTVTGLNAGDLSAATAKERADAIQQTMALVATGAASKFLPEAITPIDKAAKAATEGAVFTGVSEAGKPLNEQLAATFLGMTVAAGMSASISAISKLTKAKPATLTVDDLAKIRQLQLDEFNTPIEVSTLAEAAISGANSIDDFVLRTQLQRARFEPVMAARNLFAKVRLQQLAEENDLTVIHGGKNKTILLPQNFVKGILSDNESAVAFARAIDTFKKSGFLPGQKVSYDGTEYVFAGIKDGLAFLKSPTRALEWVDIRDLRYEKNLAISTLNLEFDFPHSRAELTKSFFKNKAASDLYNDFSNFYLERGYNDVGDGLRTARPWEQVVKEYLVKNNIDPKRYDDYNAILLQKLQGQAISMMEDGTEKANLINMLQTAVGHTDNSLTALARSNNLDLEYGYGGIVTLRDPQSKQILHTFNTSAEARAFINSLPQERTTNLTQDLGLHPLNITPSNAPLFSTTTPSTDPAFTKKPTKFLGFGNLFPFLANSHDYFTSIDKHLGTRLKAIVYDPLSAASRALQSRVHAYNTEIINLHRFEPNLTYEQDQLIGKALDSISIDELKGMLNVAQQDVASQLARMNVDQTQVLRYRLRELQVMNTPNAIKPPEVKQAEIAALKDQFGIGANEARFISLLDNSVKQYGEGLGDILRLSALLREPKLSNTMYGFMLHNNFTPGMRAITIAYRDIFNRLADELQIPDARRILNYFTHRRLYRAGDAINQYFGVPENASRFYAELTRYGFNPDYELSATNALSAYIRAGFKDRYIKPIVQRITTAEKGGISAIDAELSKGMLPDKRRMAIRRQIDDLITSFSGVPHSSAPIYEQPINFLNKITLGKFANTDIGKFVSEVNKNITFYYQSFRPDKGVRDLVSTSGKIWIQFGVKRLNRILQLATNDNANELLNKGVIERFVAYTPLLEETPDFFGSKLYTKFERLGTVGMHLSLQEQINNRIRAGIWLETWERAAKAVKARDVNLINKQLDLDHAYAPQVVKEFHSLVQAGRPDQAAKYLADNSVSTLMGNYTVGQQPLGWQSVPGRVVGKFGLWPVHQFGFMRAIFANGDLKVRALKAAKLAAYETSVQGLKIAGITAAGYSLTTGAIFTGSPILDTVHDIEQGIPNVIIAARNTAYDLVVRAFDGSGSDQKTAWDTINEILSVRRKDGSFKKKFFIPFGSGVESLVNELTDVLQGNYYSAATSAIFGNKPQP